MADWYTLRDDAPDWARELIDEHLAEYPECDGMLDHDDLADAVLDRMADSLTSRYAERATIAALRGCCDRWELVASYDHGLRCADETMVCEIATLASIIMRPVLAYMIGADDYETDPYAAACKELDYSGDGWAEPTDDDPNAERVHWLHDDVIRHRNYDQCNDVMVETSSDAGMTWLLVRESAPAGSEGN